VKAAAGKATKVIDVEHFVHVADIDPVYFDRAYFLGSGTGAEDAYRLFHDALDKAGRAAIGRFTFHNREYLAAIRPFDGVLALHTMRFADEVVAGGTLKLGKMGRAPTKREIEMAGELVASLQGAFKPARYKDQYRKAVLELIKRKAAGKKLQAPKAQDPEETGDLMKALKASLGKSRHGGRRRRAAPKKKASRR
jgi:DNA end-binding protein Ku